MEDSVDSAGVVLNKEPIADVLPLAVDRQRFVLTYIVDTHRNELLWVLMTAIVVGAVGEHDRELIGGVIRPHKVVGRGFRG